MTLPSASVAVVTYERPDSLARCLEHIAVQTVRPVEVIVVDSSEHGESGRVVRSRFAGVRYEVCPAGRGATATARDIAYRMAHGEVLAFLDDDAYAEPTWLEHLLAAYDDPSVGAAGGRQIRGQPDELTEGADAIGRLLENGTLTGNFAADPGRLVTVDHLLGASMSFRRSVLDQLGGIRDGYAGTCMREETDLCLRVGMAGHRLVYVPDAVVEHVAAPYAKGRRFDLRYTYWAQKNHLILLIRNFGAFAPIVRRYLAASVGQALSDCSVRLRRAGSRVRGGDVGGALRAGVSAVLRTVVIFGATPAGLWTGSREARRDRTGR